MTQELQTPPASKKGSAVLNLAIGALAYSAFGTAAAVLWNVAATMVAGLPVITLGSFLTLWCVWMLFFLPNIALVLSVFRALEPPVVDKEL